MVKKSMGNKTAEWQKKLQRGKRLAQRVNQISLQRNRKNRED